MPRGLGQTGQFLEADNLQCALQQLLEQRIGRGLIERTALGFQNLPVLLPQGRFELVNDAGLSDAGGPHQREDLAGLPDLQRGFFKQRSPLRAPRTRKAPWSSAPANGSAR